MSCTIYIETEKDLTKENNWLFIWSVSGDDYNTDEAIKEYEAPNRLLAAIVNLGKACYVLAVNGEHDCSVEIKSDKDGQDFRHGKEHEILYALVNPVDDFEARKLRSLYHGYTRYIGKIKQYQGQWNIKIKLVG